MKKKTTEPQLVTYLHSKGRRLGLPIAGNFELTARCNFNCPMCYVHMTQDQVDAAGRELSAAQWLELAREARDRGMVFALLTGGEPLVRKDFFEIYEGMKQMGLLISINTNASLLAGETLERFLKDPPTRFNISLYGGCNETYANMCGLPVYDRVKENIRALRKAGVAVGLNLSITQYNRADLRQIYADAVELDVNVRASSYMYPPIRVNGERFGGGDRMDPDTSAQAMLEWDLLRFPKEEFCQRAQAMAACQSVDSDGCPLEEGEGVRCRAGSSSFWLTWDGKMYPCGMMTTPVASPLRDGFGAAWEQIKAQTAQIKLPAQCSTCSHRELCGVCAAVTYTETGRFDAVPDYVCRRAQRHVQLTQEAYLEMIKDDD